jgi:hypothetical protein
MEWLTMAEVEEQATRNPENPIMQQLLAAMREIKLLREICDDPRFELLVGDRIICGESVCTVRKVEGDRAWFEGTHFGESSSGGLAKGWCKRTGAARIIRRHGAPFHVPAEFGEKKTTGQELQQTG